MSGLPSRCCAWSENWRVQYLINRRKPLKLKRMAPVAVLAAGALVLSACTGGSSEGNGADTNGGSEETDNNGETAGEYEGTDKEDLGDITTAEGDVKFSVGGTEWTGRSEERRVGKEGRWPGEMRQ